MTHPDPDVSGLVLTVEADTVVVARIEGTDIEIRITAIPRNHNQVKLRIQAPREVVIERMERGR